VKEPLLRRLRFYGASALETAMCRAEARQSVGTINRDADPACVRRRRSALSCRGLLARGAETNASLAKEVDFGTFDCACSDCRALYWLGFVVKWLFIIAAIAALIWLIAFFTGRARA
jgi:hypothetical protein